MKQVASLCIIVSLFIAGCAWLAGPAEAATRYVGENYTLIYTIQDTAGDHVTGESPTVLVRRNSDGFVYDWSDNTFKNSGWTNKTTALTEQATDGLYYKTWTPPGSETATDTYMFLVDNANTNGHGDHQAELVSYVSKPLHATVSGRTLDVTTTGAAGVDWANVEGPTTTVGLTNTTISASQVAASVSGAVGSVTGTIGGLTTAAVKDFFDTDSTTTYSAAVAGSVVKETADNAAGGSPPSAATISDAVWDEALSGHSGTGSTGKKLSDIPISGTGDWTADEKSDIKEALGVDDGVVTAHQALPAIGDKVQRIRP